MRSIHVALALAVLLAIATPALTQQVTIGTPFRTLNDSFFERTGVGFAGNWRGMNFNFGNPGLATPQFGGFDPAAGMNANFALSGKHGQANFGFNFGQGSRQSLVSQTPMLTLTNGVPGYFSANTQTPFVVSQIPVVGGGMPMGYNPYQPITPMIFPPAMFNIGDQAGGAAPGVSRAREMLQQAAANRQQGGGPALVPVDADNPRPAPPPRPSRAKANADDDAAMNIAPPAPSPEQAAAMRLIDAQGSSAGRAAPSVAEARRMHEAEKGSGDAEARVLFERGVAAEEDGNLGAARAFYQMASRRASGELKREAQSRLDALRGGSVRQ